MSSAPLEIDFYDWLRTQFTDLESAKRFAYHWANALDQSLPEWGDISSRAMAFHVSRALEGATHGFNAGALTNYLDTQYGPELFHAMWSVPG